MCILELVYLSLLKILRHYVNAIDLFRVPNSKYCVKPKKRDLYLGGEPTIAFLGFTQYFD